MKIFIKSKHVKLTDAQRDAFYKKVEHVFASISHHISRIAVSLVYQPSALGVEDIECRIKINAPGVPTVIVKTRAQNSSLALEHAVQKASINVVLKLKRKQNNSVKPILLGALLPPTSFA